jgi:hypothetical protein
MNCIPYGGSGENLEIIAELQLKNVKKLFARI